ncbi:MAG: hypothetical protein MR654_02470 [Corynebacterium glucuronolyticum]|nr:hypothetical protein [Corynebacterium glucuronolyticum]
MSWKRLASPSRSCASSSPTTLSPQLDLGIALGEEKDFRFRNRTWTEEE